MWGGEVLCRCLCADPRIRGVVDEVVKLVIRGGLSDVATRRVGTGWAWGGG